MARLGAAVTYLLAVVVGAALLVWPVRAWQRRAAGRRLDRCVTDALAEVTDLILVTISAGGSIADAVRLVAQRGPVVLQPVFIEALVRAEAGHTLARSITEVGHQLGSAYRPLMAALVATERDGAPIAALVLRLGDEARAARRRMVERRARTLPVRLLLPLACCSLPAVFIGAVLPLALVSLGRIRL